MNKELRNIEEENYKEFLEIAPESVKCNKAFISFLKEHGFFRAPASTCHHGATEGSLYQHSKGVYEALVRFTDAGFITWERPESAFIIGMFHDLCKIDTYRFDLESESWIWDDSDSIIPGHAEKSLIYLMPWIQLTGQEIACIRWHMGAFERDTKLWNYYGRACEHDSAVLYTHTADMYASRVEGV